MDTAELDTALEELELRLERLRALYEQYFMGLEKIEPQIARKDVDRRIYVLRREKIRNTAKRFKLQTIIQRYNTFQQYWQRICREIENGTYKRHLLKAQKSGQLLTIAARKRLGRAARTSEAPEPAPAAASQPPRAAASAPPPITEAPALTAATSPTLATSAAPATPAGAPPLRRPPPPVRGGEVVAAAAPPAPEATPPTAAASPPAPVRPAAPTRPAPAKFESLDLDMDFMGDWDPSATRGPAPKPAAPGKPAAAAPVPKPAAVAAAPKAAAVAPAPKPPAGPSPAAPAPPKPVAPPLPKPAAAALSARPASIPPAPVVVPPRPSSTRPPTAPARPLGGLRTPLSPRIPAAAPSKPIPKPAPAPAPPAKPAPPPIAAAPKPAPAAAASSSNVDDARLRDLHNRLQQAKQQTKEANVSYEGLAKSIRAAEAKLREQHKNRKIDFDVVIKDGKAVVKPIVR